MTGAFGKGIKSSSLPRNVHPSFIPEVQHTFQSSEQSSRTTPGESIMLSMVIPSSLLPYSNIHEGSEEDVDRPGPGTGDPLDATMMEPFRSIEDPAPGTKENPIDLDDSEMRSEISDGDTTEPFTDCSEDGDRLSCSGVTGYVHGAKGSLHGPGQEQAVITLGEPVEATQLPRVANTPVDNPAPITTVDGKPKMPLHDNSAPIIRVAGYKAAPGSSRIETRRSARLAAAPRSSRIQTRRSARLAAMAEKAKKAKKAMEEEEEKKAKKRKGGIRARRQ